MKPDINTIEGKALAYYVLAKVGLVDHLKLQKLLYYIEAWHLAFFSKSVVDEDFRAWVHGPVLLSVWHTLKDASVLNQPMLLKASAREKAISRVENQLSKDQIELIGDVLGEYGSKSGYHLECLTHAELPWQEARQGLAPDEKSSRTIKKETMRAFYWARLNKHGEQK